MQSKSFSEDALQKIKSELEKLDQESVSVDGKQLKPSQCYRFQLDPMHMLFNTNCPDTLREKVQMILHTHFPEPTITEDGNV